MLFVLKKIISGTFQPLVVAGLCIGISLCVLVRAKPRRTRTLLLLGVAFLILVVSLFDWVPNLLLHELEHRYSPYSRTEAHPQWLLVLGQGFSAEEGLSESGRVNGTMQARLSEALFRMRLSDEMKMVVSVAGRDAAPLKQKWWNGWCASVQLPVERTLLLTEAVDTPTEIKSALQYIGTHEFVLVTSAAHIPRSMQIARKLGGNPVAAPCDYQVFRSPNLWCHFAPSARHAVRLEKALHEYIGAAWFRLVRK